VIIVDRALANRHAEGRPVRVAMVGAGFMGRGIANQIVNSTPGMALVAIANRREEGARTAYQHAGVDVVRQARSAEEVDEAVKDGVPVVTTAAAALCQARTVDAIIEVTGTVEYAARIVLEAIENRKHVILMNAELDGTIGPLLKHKADLNGVIVSACDGDQPGVQMNLYRFVQSIGVTPLVCGNIKGLQDEYRNPTTQASFAKRWGQNVHMVTSFADGTKISFEQAIVANATGMTVASRGMLGYSFDGHVDELTQKYDVDALRQLGGIVDYVVGAQPGPGVYVLGTHDDPKQQHYLELYKLGRGPLYSFYTPYHLCHFEVPQSVARAVLFDDAVLQPIAGPCVDVMATAKVELRSGTVLDGIGGYHIYGQCEKYDIARAEGALPMGLAEGCIVRRDIPRDTVLTLEDVTVPENRLADRLWAEQDSLFSVASTAV
jgi:predicted homoserine dehydrogenase-like protein